MRFLIDAQLPPDLVYLLRQRGHEAFHVNRLRLGSASDRAIWDYACASNSTILSKDADFLRFALESPFPAPVVWVRLGNTTNAALRGLLSREIDRIVEAIEGGESVIELR